MKRKKLKNLKPQVVPVYADNRKKETRIEKEKEKEKANPISKSL